MKIYFPLAGIRSGIDSSACGNAHVISASGDFVTMYRPRERRCHENLHFPLAGIRSSADSACGNATKILHLRERIFCNYFGSRSRLRKCTISCVSGNTKRIISACRNRMCAVPQAVLQDIRSFFTCTRYTSAHLCLLVASTSLPTCNCTEKRKTFACIA